MINWTFRQNFVCMSVWSGATIRDYGSWYGLILVISFQKPLANLVEIFKCVISEGRNHPCKNLSTSFSVTEVVKTLQLFLVPFSLTGK